MPVQQDRARQQEGDERGGDLERRGDMVHGKLEVLLVCAKGLEDTDFLSKPSSSSSSSDRSFLPFLAVTLQVVRV